MKNRIANISILCCLLMVMSASATSAQTRRSLAQRSNGTEQMRKATAAWTPFFAKFRRAIRNRDHKTLRAMFSSNFEGRGSIGGIDEHINDWLSMQMRRSILAQKHATFQNRDDNIIKRYIVMGTSDVNCSIGFEFRNDGKWDITDFGCHSE